MNKSQLVDALAERLGDRRTAATAVEGLLETIVDTVRSGDSVSITGFGVFESRPRAARTARNPRTGDTVAVPATTVPAFRPGTSFRSAVSGSAVGGTAVGSSSGTSAPAPKATKGAASFAASEPATETPEKSSKSSKPVKDGRGAKTKAKSGKADKSGDKGKKAKSKK